MKYEVRKAVPADLPRIGEIYGYARKFMAENGNPTQWGQNHPSAAQQEADIRAGSLYVITREMELHGVFFFGMGPDGTYANIDGCWHLDMPYGVIHRIAGDGSGGILKTAVAFAETHTSYIRIDTHENNLVMQNALQKQGFRRCGIIHVEDGSPRIAYDYITVP